MVISFDRWVGKVAVVTGASSGFGVAIARRLVEEGVNVVGVARRIEILELIANQLKGKRGKLYAFKANVAIEEDILNAFKWTKENVGPVSILVNNAAYLSPATSVTAVTNEFLATFNINVIGLAVATREAIKMMRENNIDGHIININSVVGHQVPTNMFNIYPPSKFAVTAITETLRLELNSLKSKIKVTSLSPGAVEMPMLHVTLEGANLTLEARLEPEDIADGVVYVLSTPPHVQIQELTIKPVGEVY